MTNIRKNIAFFSHESGVYGATRSLIDIILGLKKYNCHAIVFIPNKGQIEKILIENNIEYFIFPYKAWVTGIQNEQTFFLKLRTFKFKLQKYLKNLFLLKKITNILKQYKIQYIYTNTITIPIGFLASRKLKINHIWHIREFGMLDHGFKFDFGNKFSYKRINKSKRVFVISKAVKIFYKSRISTKKLKIIYNGVFSKKSYKDIQYQEFSLKKKTIRFLMVGQIKKTKGQYDAIKAFSEVVKKHQNIKLIIVGAGEIDKIKKYRNDLKLEKYIQIIGHLDNPLKEYENADVFLMCSHNEAFGRVTIEAMAYGLPVIGLNRKATKELVENNKNGLLYGQEYRSLENAIELMLNKPELITTLGNNAYNYVRENFSIEKMTEDIYKELSIII